MKKLSEFHGDAALDIIADMISPAAKILADAKIKEAFRSNSKLEVAQVACRTHKNDVFAILALLSEVSVDDYKAKCNPLTIVNDVMALLNDKDAMQVFSSAGQTEEE